MKLHRLDIVSLIFGLIFATIGLAFVFSPDPWALFNTQLGLAWIGPAALIVVGLLILASIVRRESQTSVAHPGEPPMVDSFEADIEDAAVMAAAKDELAPDPQI